MNSLFANLKLDVRLQARSKLYTIGIVAAVLLGLVGRFFVHPDYAGRLLAVVYLTGLGGTTYFFAASLVLMEKSEGTLDALRTTPLTSTTYILSKVITLSTFATLESVIVYAVAFFGVPLSPLPMIFGVLALGVLYTLVGLGQVASYDSVTTFLFPGAVLVVGVSELPLFYLITGPNLIWYLVPTHGSMLLMLGATEALEIWQWVYAILGALTSIMFAFWWAKYRFARFVSLQEG